MSIKSVVYNRDLVAQARQAFRRLNDSFEAMAHIIDTPEHSPASKWFDATEIYEDALEELEGVVGCFIKPDDLRDPGDLAVKEILKSLEESPKREKPE